MKSFFVSNSIFPCSEGVEDYQKILISGVDGNRTIALKLDHKPSWLAK